MYKLWRFFHIKYMEGGYTMKRTVLTIIFIATLTMLSACKSNPTASGDDQYEATKEMVVDILKTDEGKKALSETLQDKELQQQFLLHSDETKEMLTQTLTSEKGKAMWQDLLTDTEFKGSLAKSLTNEHTEVAKELLKDPDYQKQLYQLLKNPEVTKQLQDAIKSQKVKKHLETTIEEIISSPKFEKRLLELLDEQKKHQKDS